MRAWRDVPGHPGSRTGPARWPASSWRGRCAGRRRLWDQVGARDLCRGQAAEQAQRQRDPRLHREHGMAGGEDQRQQVIVDIVGDRAVELGRSVLVSGLEVRLRSRRTCAPGRGSGGTGLPHAAWPPSSARRQGSAARRRRGHCSSAATTASWASSSARPMSPPAYLASPAMSRADSIRMTVSMAA